MQQSATWSMSADQVLCVFEQQVDEDLSAKHDAAVEAIEVVENYQMTFAAGLLASLEKHICFLLDRHAQQGHCHARFGKRCRNFRRPCSQH